MRRSLAPLLTATLCLASFLLLTWEGASGFWTSQLHDDMGGGLLSLIILAAAVWAAAGALANLWLWRRSTRMGPRRIGIVAASAALFGAGPPLLSSYWIVELLLWKARNR